MGGRQGRETLDVREWNWKGPGKGWVVSVVCCHAFLGVVFAMFSQPGLDCETPAVSNLSLGSCTMLISFLENSLLGEALGPVVCCGAPSLERFAHPSCLVQTLGLLAGLGPQGSPLYTVQTL